MSSSLRYTCVSTFIVMACAASAHAQSGEPTNRCATTAPLTVSAGQAQWNGWGASPTQQRFQPAERAKLSADAVPKLTLKWAFGFPGAQGAYGQPSIAGNRLFVGSHDGTVYALAADTGCLHWTFKAGTQVRTAISIGMAGSTLAIYFGDQSANAYAVNANTGALLWKTHVDEHPAARITGAPTLANGVLYVPTSSSEEGLAVTPAYSCCTFRGSVSALNASSGAVIWKSYTIAESPKPTAKNKSAAQMFGPSGAGIWSSPTVDLQGGMVVVTTGNNYSDPPTETSDAFVAFDLKTGKLLWSKQMNARDATSVACDLPEPLHHNCPDSNGPDFDFGSSAVLVNLGGGKRALIAGQKSGVVHAIDPDRGGEILWQRKIGQGGRIGGIQWGVSADATHVYAALSDVQMTAPLPDGKGGRPTMFGIPMMLNPDAGGGLFALDLKTGEIAWKTPHPGCNKTPGCSPAQSAATTAIPGVVFSGGLDGHLRAYDAKTGRIIWDTDTARKFDTVNGVEAKGGSLDGSGAVVVDGMVYVNSGYIFTGHTPGNVLLAFGLGVPTGARVQTAEEIIAANITASGGEEAIARIKNFRHTGRVTVESPLFGKLEGTLETVHVPGRGYYEHVVLGPIQQSKGWDGTRGWEQSPTGLRMLEGVESQSLKMLSFVNPFVALRAFAAAGLRIERLEDAEVHAKPQYVLAVKTADGPTSTMYIDRQTSLLTRTSVTVVVPNVGEAPVVTDVDAYKVVAGVRTPTMVTQAVEGISTTRLTLDDMVVNTAVDATIFAGPER